jgi:Na+-driven multidrug efflux pump
LIAPAWTIVVGTTLAIAVRVGHAWPAAIATEVVTVLFALGYYILSGTKSDVGAIYGQRKDERQRHVVMRASRLSMIIMFATSFVIVLFMVASNKTYWQEDVIASVGGVAYFLGLLIYGAHEEDEGGTARGIMSSDPAPAGDKKNNVIPPL